MRNAWSKVVNNLDANIRYNQKYLAHTNHNDNEVDSGLVNIMRVLDAVFNLELESEPVYQNDIQYVQAVTEWATIGLETFFKTLAPEKQNVTIHLYNVATYTARDNRKDCSGAITIQVEQDFKFVISATSGHAQFDSITRIISINNEQISYNTNSLQHSAGEQILLLNDATKSFVTTPLHKLFSINVIDSAAIITMLEKLHPMLKEKRISYTRGKSILQNALQSFLWQDREMSENIQPVIRDLLGLKSTIIDEVLQQEVRTFIYNENSDRFETGELVLEFFKNIMRFKIGNQCNQKNLNISGNTCPNLKQLELNSTQNLESVLISGSFNALEIIDLSYSDIKNLNISGDNYPKLKYLFLDKTNNLETAEIFGSFNALEIIQLSTSGIKNLNISGGNYHHLKKLSLAGVPNLNSPKLLGFFNGLKEIDLSCSGIKNLSISGNNCPNLEQLTLDLTKSLESVELSESFNQLKIIDLWCSGIKELELDKNAFPKLKIDDPRIKLINKKRKRDEDDNFEEEVEKENKYTKLDETEQAVGPNN